MGKTQQDTTRHKLALNLMMLKILFLSALVGAASAACVDPASTVGYDITGITKAFSTFDGSGILCAIGYTGTPTCTKCASDTGAYTLAGCTVCSTSNLATLGGCTGGCPLNYYQGTVKGSTNSKMICAACAPGYLIAGKVPDAAATACTTKCTLGAGAAIGSCKTGCPLNSYQKVGTTTSLIECHACAATKTAPAAALKAAVVTDSVCVAATNQHADKCTTSSTTKNSDLSGYEDKFACTTANTAKGYTLSGSTDKSAVPCTTGCTHCAAGYFQTELAFDSKAGCSRCAGGYTIANAIVGSAATTCTVEACTSGAAFVPTGLAVVMAMVVTAVAI